MKELIDEVEERLEDSQWLSITDVLLYKQCLAKLKHLASLEERVEGMDTARPFAALGSRYADEYVNKAELLSMIREVEE